VNCYRFIEAEKAGRRNVARACALLKVSRAGCYQHLAGPSRRDRAGAGLTEQIRAVHEESRGRYGSPRVHAELRRRGHRHGRKRAARLMRHAGIWGKTPKRWKKTTIAGSAAARADAIQRDFSADASKINSRWCGDITYAGTWQGWLYLATVTGIASRRVVGYTMADHLRTELVSGALANAVAARDPAPGVIFHADRGCQGGFNRPSRHLDSGGVDGQACGVDDGVDRPVADEVAGCAVASPGGRTRVLACDRQGAARGGGRARRRRVAGGRCTVVPAPWGDAVD
jgi:putative transposase